MYFLVVYLVALGADASAHHLGLKATLLEPWVAVEAVKYLGADAVPAAPTHPVLAASASSPILSVYGPADAAFPWASAAKPLTRALVSAGDLFPSTFPSAKVCSGGFCSMIPNVALYTPSETADMASSLALPRAVLSVFLPVPDVISPAVVFMVPTSVADALGTAKYAAAAGVMVPIAAASPAAAFIVSTNAADSLATAKYAAAGGVMVPIAAASPAAAFTVSTKAADSLAAAKYAAAVFEQAKPPKMYCKIVGPNLECRRGKW